MSTQRSIASRSKITRLRPAVFLAALALAGTATHAAAQTVPAGGQASDTRNGQVRPRVEGRVINQATGEPLRYATVEIASSRRLAVTDSAGRFRFDHVRPGAQEIRASLIGYGESSQTVNVDGAVTVEIRLTGDPVLLKGLTVTTNRFERRLRFYRSAVRVLDRGAIASSGARNTRDFVAMSGGLNQVFCGRDLVRGCVISRGRVIEPAVYLNDMPTIGGLEHLEVIPVDEVDRVEVLASGQQVRVYTTEFIEWAARSRYTPPPILSF